MMYMRKIFALMFCVFFLVGSFIVVFNVALVSGLVADSWNTKMSMGQARWGLGVVEVDGKIYAIGGYDVNGCVGANECYDPVSDSWTFLTSMPTQRACFAIAAYDGKIYCIGGETRDVTGVRIDLGVNEVYDTVTDSWSTKEPLPVGGTYLHAGTVNGKIFVIVDHDVAAYDYSQDLYMYNPVTDVWTKKASMPDLSAPGVFITLAVVDDTIIVTSAYSLEDALNGRYGYKVMIYDTKTDTWRTGASVSSIVHFGAAGVTTGDYVPQKVYVIGLASGSDPSLLTNRVYDPTSDTWSHAKTMPTLRKGFGVAVVNDLIYVIGGYTSNDFSSFSGTTDPSALNEQYVPLGYDGDNSDNYELKPFSNYITAALVVIIIVTAVIILTLYSKREEKIKKTNY